MPLEKLDGGSDGEAVETIGVVGCKGRCRTKNK